MTFVLDTSALLAVLWDEPGRDRVVARMADSAVSAVTWAEVVARLVERNALAAQIEMAANLVVGRVRAFDAAQGEISGRLRAATRGAGLSLGDRCCLALAVSLKATAVTADRAWAAVDAGVAVELIR